MRFCIIFCQNSPSFRETRRQPDGVSVLSGRDKRALILGGNCVLALLPDRNGRNLCAARNAMSSRIVCRLFGANGPRLWGGAQRWCLCGPQRRRHSDLPLNILRGTQFPPALGAVRVFCSISNSQSLCESLPHTHTHTLRVSSLLQSIECPLSSFTNTVRWL